MIKSIQCAYENMKKILVFFIPHFLRDIFRVKTRSEGQLRSRKVLINYYYKMCTSVFFVSKLQTESIKAVKAVKGMASDKVCDSYFYPFRDHEMIRHFMPITCD